MPIEVGDGNRSENSSDWTPREKSRDPSIKWKDWTTRQKTRSEIGDWRDRKMSDHFYFNPNAERRAGLRLEPGTMKKDLDSNSDLWKKDLDSNLELRKRTWTRTWIWMKKSPYWRKHNRLWKEWPTCLAPLQAPVRGLASEKGLRGSGRGGEFILRDTDSTVKRLRDDE